MDPEFDDVVAVEDLVALERRWQAQRGEGPVSPQVQFQYGWGLVRSPYRGDIERGVALLSELLAQGTREEQRDYLYYLALGNYRLKEYERALSHIDRLLAAEPQNPQGLRLRGHIRERLRRDGLLGVAIVGGVAVGVAGLAGLLGVAIARARR